MGIDTIVSKAKKEWESDFQSSSTNALKNATIIAKLRRTLKPLKHYRRFIDSIGLSERNATRLVRIGNKDKDLILTNNINNLPNSYATIDIICRFDDKVLLKHFKSGKISRKSTRKDIHILLGDKEVKRRTGLPQSLSTSSPFTEVRVTSSLKDLSQIEKLNKDLKSLSNKYSFVKLNDKGFTTRVKNEIKKQELEKKKQEREIKSFDKDFDSARKHIQKLIGKKKTKKNPFKGFKI
jgi:hypothetical protein